MSHYRAPGKEKKPASCRGAQNPNPKLNKAFINSRQGGARWRRWRAGLRLSAPEESTRRRPFNSVVQSLCPLGDLPLFHPRNVSPPFPPHSCLIFLSSGAVPRPAFFALLPVISGYFPSINPQVYGKLAGKGILVPFPGDVSLFPDALLQRGPLSALRGIVSATFSARRA